MTPPLRPDAPTAHQWLADELQKAQYDDRPGLLERLQEWLESWLSAGDPSSAPVGTVVAIILGLLLLVVAFFVVRRFRATGPGARKAGTVTDSEVGPLNDPAGHRDAAERHRAAGEHAAAVIESFRALVATAADRRSVVVIPGLTAQHAADQLTRAHPQFGTELRRAADCFDRARYADARPLGTLITAEDAETVAGLEERVAAARPERTGTSSGSGGTP